METGEQGNTELQYYCGVCGFVYGKSGYPFPNISISHNEDWEYCHHCSKRVYDTCTALRGELHLCADCSEPLIQFTDWLKSKQIKKRRSPSPPFSANNNNAQGSACGGQGEGSGPAP
jgi:hypothetical protein